MHYSEIKPYDIANGEGVRVSLWVSGCERHCKGCFNESTWDFEAGKEFDGDTVHEIIELMKPDYIQGLTILGGEPLHPKNLYAIDSLLYNVRFAYGSTKDIWLYTGYTYDEVKDLPLMSHIDILVDGPFIEEEKDISLKFRGSRNQRIIDLKGRENE